MTRAPLLLLVLALLGCSSANGDDALEDPPASGPVETAPPEPSERVRVLVAGDSIAGGYYASAPDRAFDDLLDDRIASENQDAAVVPVTIAVSGARAFRVAAGVESATVVAEPFDVAVLEAGTADIGVSTVRELAAGYTRLLASVEARSPDAEVVCLGPWDRPQVTRPFEAAVRRVCADHVFVPLSDLFADRSLHGPAGESTPLGKRDWYHPNDQGHEAIAARVAEALDA